MLFAEGHPEPDGLCSPSDLPAVFEQLEAQLCDRGVLPPSHRLAPVQNGRGDLLPVIGGSGFAGIGRWDATLDVERSSAVGLAILRGVAAVEPPGHYQVQTHRAKAARRLQTVTWFGVRGKVARIYDKGIESGSHRVPGERLRFEDQRRWHKRDRWTLKNVASEAPAIMFRHRFEPLRQATKGLVVVTHGEAMKRLKGEVEAGRMQPGMAHKVLAHLMFEREGYQIGSRTTRYRHRVKAREAGLVLADGELEDVEIDLEAELGELFDS